MISVNLSKTGQPWMDASRVSLDRLNEAVNQPSDRMWFELGENLTMTSYRWFGEDFVLYITGHARPGDWRKDHRGEYHVKLVQIDVIIRIWVGGPVTGLSKKMSVTSLSQAVTNAFARPVKEGDENIPPGGVFVFRWNADASAPRVRVMVSVDEYRRKMAQFSEPLSRLPALEPLRKLGQPVHVQLRNMCDELLSLIKNTATSEEDLHQWLNQERHRVFVDPMAKEVRSKVPFGAFVSDFVVRRSDDTYLLVEIEPASAQRFKKNGEFTQHFHHALEQVKDWQNFIADNVHTVREEQDLAEIDNPAGLVVIGERGQFDALKKKARKEAKRRWRKKKREDPAPLCWTELVGRIASLADQLEVVDAAASGHVN